MPSIFFSLNAQFCNLGDEIINTQLIMQLAKRGKVFALSSNVPDWYLRNIKYALRDNEVKIEFVNNRFHFFLQMLKSSLNSEAALLVTSCGDISMNRETPLRDLAIEVLLKTLRMGIASIGISFSNMSESKLRLWRKIHHAKRYIAPRDSKTAALLAEQGVDAECIPDLAFGLPYTRLPGIRGSAAISLRETELPPTLLKITIENSMHVVNSIGHELITTWQVDYDKELTHQLSDTFCLKLLKPETVLEGRQQALEAIYDQCDFVISNRLHVLLLAASRGARPIPLLTQSETKIRSIFEDCGLTSQIIEAKDKTSRQEISDAIKSSETNDYRELFFKYSKDIENYFSKI